MTGAVAVLVVLHIVFLPTAPTSPLCEDGSYRSAHPLICDTGTAAAPGGFPGGGSGRGRGGLIGGLLGGLTGGLL